MSHRLTPNRLLLFVALVGAAVTLALGPIAPAWAQTSTTTGGTVLICEATGNPNAPYVEVDVPQADLGNYSAAAGDIIPAPASGCPAKAAGTTGPTKKHPRPVKHPKPAHKTPTATPAPLTSTAPAAAQPAVPASVFEPTEAASVQTLPKTGGHTPITIVLGLLLLYCGVVIRWAVTGPGPGSPRLGAPRR